ncbi:MAG: hypothetical protein H6719_07840 [Sandaracinaceae bacterium]|nr:hypothetical protein [Sandaracinaceae bacterium]
MRRGRATGWLACLALASIGCGGAPTPEPATPAPEATGPVMERLSPPGSRMSVLAPPAQPIPHTLRWRAGALELSFADATVAEGAERAVATAYLAQLRERYGEEIAHRPFALDGAEGVEVTVDAAPRLRAVMIWRDGAIARLAVTYAEEDALDAARVIDSLSFDARAPIDPKAALGLEAAEMEELPLVPVSTEQLVFREGGHPGPFARLAAAVDVAYLDLAGETPDERERGRLLGGRFRGMPLEAPELAELQGEGATGFAMQAYAIIEGVRLTLLGAYLEVEGGVLLVRASVPTERAEVWAPRLWALIRSLRVQ